MTSGRSLLVLAFVAASLSGCAGKQVQPISPVRAQALEHNRRGVEAEGRGDRERAVAEFAEALRLQGSIENTDGMVVALVNLARTRRLAGDLNAARESVERALALLPEKSDLAAEVHFEKAKVLQAFGDLAGATAWALSSEAAEQGDGKGRRLNLVALLMLRQGMPEKARETLERALAANRSAGMQSEEANSLRLFGEVALSQGDLAKARESYQGALHLDKELGLSARIAADLSGLGEVAARKGEHAAAVDWYRRSLEVSRSGMDLARAAAALDRLAELHRLAGEEKLAREAAEERKALARTVSPR